MKIRNFFMAICLAFLFCQPTYAKGILLFNTGDELFEVADFPEQLMSEFRELKGSKAGYKCGHFGLFWADVWSWDCTLVGVSSDTSYSDLPAQVASRLKADPQYAMSHAKRSFWNHYGILVCLAGLAGYSLLRRIL